MKRQALFTAGAWLLSLGGLAIGEVGCHNPRAGSAGAASAVVPPKPAPDAVLSLFVTAQIEGTTEPCGCSSEPLGDVSRIAELLKQSGSHGLLLDAGALRYKQQKLPPEMQQQARLKADFLEATWHELGAVTALQPSDLAGPGGLAELSPGARLGTNVSVEGATPEKSPLRSEELRTVGGVKIGILGLSPPEPEMPWPAAVKVGPPIEAAQQAVARLRAQGATSIIALTGLRRDAARRLCRKVPEINLVVVGGESELHDGAEQAEQVGTALIVVPAIEGQRIVRVDLHLDQATQQPVWTLQRTARQLEQAAAGVKQQLAIVKTRLETLRNDPQAEPAFVQTTQAEVERLSGELARLTETAAPSRSGYVTAELLPIGRKLGRDRQVAGAMSALDRRIGEANLASLSAPPAASAGAASYIGIAGCQGACHFHDDAIEFWQKTRHAKAFPTLVEVGKELSYDCVNCHAVGFDAPGGSNLWSLAAWQKSGAGPKGPIESPIDKRPLPDLRNVQCEVCHGPGSLHAAAPSKNPIPIPRPTQERCLICHTKDHSDTFDFVPYLRDIVGPGHGADRRTALGPGPTGQELRSAAQKKSQTAL